MAINNESSRKGLCQLTFRSYKKSLDKLLSVENKSMTSHCLKRYRILSLIPSKKRENNWKNVCRKLLKKFVFKERFYKNKDFDF